MCIGIIGTWVGTSNAAVTHVLAAELRVFAVPLVMVCNPVDVLTHVLAAGALTTGCSGA